MMRKRRGTRLPLQALTPAAAAAGQYALDAQQRALLSAFRALPQSQQKMIVVGALQSGSDSIGEEDIPGGVEPVADFETGEGASLTDTPPDTPWSGAIPEQNT